MNFYLVGGAVRDRLLGFEPEERDWVVVGATVEELKSLGFKRLDADFPVFAHPQTGEEYALARRERKTAPGHKGFVVEFGPDVSLEEDLLRRDLRLNAIAESETGELIDPYGGRADIASRTLRHVSPAFVEDPLRVLRAARFAAKLDPLGFSVHPSTLELMRAMSTSDELGALSPARIWGETEKALATDRPARYFEALAQCGALGILLPGPCADTGSKDSPCAAARNALLALEAAAALDGRTEVRFAALALALRGAEGSAVIDHICGRYPVPKKHAELAQTAAALRSDLLSGSPLGAKRVLAALERADAFRRAERFNDALLVLTALETAGEKTLSGKPKMLSESCAAAQAVSGAELSSAGLRGKNLAAELDRRRLLAVEKALATRGKAHG